MEPVEWVRVATVLNDELIVVLEHFTYGDAHERNARRAQLVRLRDGYLAKGWVVPTALWDKHFHGTREWIITTMANALRAGA